MLRSFRLLFVIAICGALIFGPLAGPASAQSPKQLSGLQSSLEQYVGGLGGSYGVYVLDLNSDNSVDVDGEETFPTASMYKLLVMYRVFQAVDQGNLSLDDQITITDQDLAPENPELAFSVGDTPTVEGALDQMITVSDNAAAFALTRQVGGWQSVISAADDLGMPDTVFTDDFYSTPQDLAHFFRLLAARQLVSPAASTQMLDLLASQQVNDRIPAQLPEGVSVAHKTGELPGVRNDGGIVTCNGKQYIVVMMSRDGDPSVELPAEAQMSRMIYDQLCG